MNYKILITIISIFFLASCEHNKINKGIIEENTVNKIEILIENNEPEVSNAIKVE